MKDENESKKQLIGELHRLRQRHSRLETDSKGVAAALRESEKRYRRITEAITDYIFTVKVADGHPAETHHGPTCEAVTGYTAE